MAISAAAAVPVARHARAPIEEPADTIARGPQCTPALVDTALRDPRLDDEQRAACLAIAGRVIQARALLDRLPHDGQTRAVAQIFAIAHPTADAGNDAAVVELMELVADFDPSNYMALYHAGMVEYASYQNERARDHLARLPEGARSSARARRQARRALRHHG